MSTSPLSPDDIRAAAEAHAELDPQYRDAVVESFLAKVDNEIDARVEARLATASKPRRHDLDPVAASRRRGLTTGLALGLTLGTVVAGFPLTQLVIWAGDNPGMTPWPTHLWLIWAAIALFYGVGAAAILRWNRRDTESAEGRSHTARPRVYPKASS
jgi:hypothetical protein